MSSRPSNRTWRRRLTRAILCLLLGAVTTVGVAWGAAMAATPAMREWSCKWRAIAVGGGQEWGVSYKRSSCCTNVYVLFGVRPGVVPGSEEPPRYTRPPPAPVLASAEATAANLPIDRLQDAPLWRHVDAPWAQLPEGVAPHERSVPVGGWRRESLESVAMGWPQRCLMYVHFWEATWLQDSASTSGTRGGFWWRRTLLPYTVIPRGFLLNTLFYAAPWWFIVVTPGAVKRWRRRHRGRCIHCGYDLTGLSAEDRSPKCPECGR